MRPCKQNPGGLDATLPAPRQRTLIEQIEDRQFARRGRINLVPEQGTDSITLAGLPGVNSALYYCPENVHTASWKMPPQVMLTEVFDTPLATRI